MMIVHEFGHVLHAWLSGGRVDRVVLHPLQFSRTDLSVNPRPLFVAWGGAIWGCIFPLIMWLLARGLRLRLMPLFRFFAGFCLIANGLYLATALVMPICDAEDPLRLGAPLTSLIGFGFLTTFAGVLFWSHARNDFGLGATSPASGTLAISAAPLVALALGMLAWSSLTSP